MKTLLVKIIESIFLGIFSLLIFIPLLLAYAIGIACFQFGSTLLQDIDELITYNKQIWK